MDTNNNLKTVAIIGRPNVGKSTLFNRLVGRRVAIETPIAGTTRDRLYEIVEWNGSRFNLIDAAGLEKGSKSELAKSMQESVKVAEESADLILFAVDWNEKDSEEDRSIAKLLKRIDKPVLMVVNKADNVKRQKELDIFRRLGGYKIIPVSAINGKNSGDLLDEVVSILNKLPDRVKASELSTETEIKLAIIGRPNVGKSTLLNSIIGEKRAIVSEEPGTTRDVVSVNFFHKGKKILISDTAGIRKRGKISKETIESLGVIRTYRALKSCEVAVLVIDAKEGLVANDAHILGLAKEWGKGAVLAVNKLDLVDGDKEQYIESALFILQHKLNFVPWLPVVFISAKEEENIKHLLDQVVTAYQNRMTTLPVSDLQEITEFVRGANPQLVNLKSITQKHPAPPTFELSFSGKRLPHETQIRYLENKIRDVYPMTGTPIFIDIKIAPKKSS